MVIARTAIRANCILTTQTTPDMMLALSHCRASCPAAHPDSQATGAQERMVTLKEVAQEAGVSTQTASRAVSGKGYVAAETRARVNAAIRRLGYAPNRVASSMATGRTMSIGMVVPDISYSFFPEIVLGAETEARQAGYNLILCNTAESDEQERRVIAVPARGASRRHHHGRRTSAGQRAAHGAQRAPAFRLDQPSGAFGAGRQHPIRSCAGHRPGG